MFGAFLALLFARVIQRIFWRARPIEAIPDLNIPYYISKADIASRNSFPSDTATLVFSISTIIFLQNRRLGVLAFGWSALVVSLPRIYFGLHYLSDVVGGAILAVLTVSIATWALSARMGFALNAIQRWPGVAGGIGFLFLFAMGTMFTDLRALAFLWLGME